MTHNSHPPTDELSAAQSLDRRLVAARKAQRGAEHQLAVLLTEMAAGGFRMLGYASIKQYATIVLELPPRMARNLLRIGHALPSLPTLDRALADGALDWTKAREILRVVTPANEAGWVERAQCVSARVIEQEVACAVRGDPAPVGAHQPEREPMRRRVCFDMETSDAEVLRQALALLRCQSDLDPSEIEDGALLAAMARTMVQGAEFWYASAADLADDDGGSLLGDDDDGGSLLGADDDAGSPRGADDDGGSPTGAGDVGPANFSSGPVSSPSGPVDPRGSLATELGGGRTAPPEPPGRSGLAGSPCTEPRGGRTAPPEPPGRSGLAGSPCTEPRGGRTAPPEPPGRSGLAGSPCTGEPYRIVVQMCPSCGHMDTPDAEVSDTIAAEACCDAEIVDMRPGPHQGHATRKIPPALRRRVFHRAGWTCEVPNCKNKLFLDVHHTDPWAKSHSHVFEKLMVTCDAHHRAIHSGGLAVELDKDDCVCVEHADGRRYVGKPRVRK